MFARGTPTGLHGWIRSNDGRSLGLFAAFLLAIQLIAPLVLLVPLTLGDLAHAPFFDWGGYALRYVPLVLLASVGWFAVQLWWHVQTVKRAVGFEFVDADDEPRLCRVLEPLVVLTGLPVPFVGVIEDRARNAFACGIGRRKAVVVVTRGLLDALDDHELAAVLAHELSHIKHGDIRLMAAANIFMGALAWLHAKNGLRFTWVHALISFAVPAMLPMALAGGMLGRWGLKAGQASRLLIASSREFLADAEAAQWTQNPAALAAALLKVDGRHRIEGARREDDAMMIAGDTEGADATHPSVAQRIAALARVTGSMVFNAPSAPRPEDWTSDTAPEALARQSFGRRTRATAAIAQVRQGDGEDALGLDLFGRCALAASLIGLLLLHAPELDDPDAIAAKFSLRPVAALVGSSTACMLSPLTIGAKEQCAAKNNSGAFRDFEGQRHTLAGMLADMSRARRESGYADADVTVSSLMVSGVDKPFTGESGRLRGATAFHDADDDAIIDTPGRGVLDARTALTVMEYDQVGCFPAIKSPKRDRTLSLDEKTTGGISIAKLQSDADVDADLLLAGPPTAAMGATYARGRELHLSLAYAEFGRPGLDALLVRYAMPSHVDALARLRDSEVELSRLSPLSRASIRALLRAPGGFVPCRSLQPGT